MSQPLDATRQNDVLVYRLSSARAVTHRSELSVTSTGASVSDGIAPIGTESRGLMKLGGRFTQGPVRFDAAIFFGLNTVDPTVGFTAGATYVFTAFRLP
jgi:hypothetical protein